jgi:hypothetical protein
MLHGRERRQHSSIKCILELLPLGLLVHATDHAMGNIMAWDAKVVK